MRPHRPTVLLLTLLALAAALLLAHQARPETGATHPLPPLGPRLGTPRPPSDAIQIRFQDQSPTWNWQNRCQHALARFIQAHGFPVTRLQVTLTDDSDLPLGVAYPDPEHPRALALGQCEARNSGLVCQVALVKGEADPAGEAALAGVMAYALGELFRERSATAWARRAAWDWGQLAPLLRREGEAWRSDCLALEGR